MTDIKVGDRVRYVRAPYTKVGSVVEVDLDAGRARVFWDGDKRTWVKFSALTPAAGAAKRGAEFMAAMERDLKRA